MLTLIGTKSYPSLPHVDVPSDLAEKVPRGRYAMKIQDNLGNAVYFIVRGRRKLKSGLIRLYADHVRYA